VNKCDEGLIRINEERKSLSSGDEGGIGHCSFVNPLNLEFEEEITLLYYYNFTSYVFEE